jgi:hypothetical protein
VLAYNCFPIGHAEVLVSICGLLVSICGLLE